MFRDGIGPLLRTVEHAQNTDGVVVDPVSDDVGSALDDQFARTFDAARATRLRKLLQGCGCVCDAFINQNRGAGVLSVDVVVNSVAVRLCVVGPLQIHPAVPVLLSKEAARR